MFGKSALARACAVVGLAVALGGAGIAAATAASAAPAQCPQGGSNCVNASLTIGQTLTLTVSTSSITFTGSPGGVSNTPTVSWTGDTNDPGGMWVGVQAIGANLSGENNAADTIPWSDIDVWGATQLAGSCTAAACGVPVPNAAPLKTYSGTGAGAVSGTDTYGFTGPGAGGSNIPANAVADTYEGGVQYYGIGN